MRINKEVLLATVCVILIEPKYKTDVFSLFCLPFDTLLMKEIRNEYEVCKQ